MSEAVVGFASGVGVSVLAALLGAWLQGFKERRKSIDRTLFEVYMLFLDLLSAYFWIASSEVHNEESSPEMRKKSQELAWRIADMLRKEDRIPFMDELLSILMAEGAYRSAVARHDAMNDLADRMGKRVNPRYKKAIGSMTPGNLEAVASKPLQQRNAPGQMWT